MRKTSSNLKCPRTALCSNTPPSALFSSFLPIHVANPLRVLAGPKQIKSSTSARNTRSVSRSGSWELGGLYRTGTLLVARGRGFSARTNARINCRLLRFGRTAPPLALHCPPPPHPQRSHLTPRFCTRLAQGIANYRFL
jgi:hypothetical protein